MAITLADIERMYSPQSLQTLRGLGATPNQQIFQPYDPTILERQEQARQLTEQNEYNLEDRRRKQDFDTTVQQMAEQQRAASGTLTVEDIYDIMEEAGLATGNVSEVIKAGELRERRADQQAKKRNQDIDRLMALTESFGPGMASNVASIQGLDVPGIDLSALDKAMIQQQMRQAELDAKRRKMLFPQQGDGGEPGIPTASGINAVIDAAKVFGPEYAAQVAKKLGIPLPKNMTLRTTTQLKPLDPIEAVLRASIEAKGDKYKEELLYNVFVRPHTADELELIKTGKVSSASNPTGKVTTPPPGAIIETVRPRE